MDEQKKIVVAFPPKADSAVSELVKKNNLQESQNEITEKVIKGQLTKINVIYKLTRDLVSGKIIEANFVASLQKDLAIAAQTAKDLAKDIATNVVPLLEKVPEDQLGMISAERLAGVGAPGKPAGTNIETIKALESTLGRAAEQKPAVASKEEEPMFPPAPAKLGVAPAPKMGMPAMEEETPKIPKKNGKKEIPKRNRQDTYTEPLA